MRTNPGLPILYQLKTLFCNRLGGIASHSISEEKKLVPSIHRLTGEIVAEAMNELSNSTGRSGRRNS